MIQFSNAKINIGLKIVNKRSDGFHDLESIFVPLPFFDALEVKKSDHFSFTNVGLTIDSPLGDNLVEKAYQLIKSRYSIPPVELVLLKNIPFGAGLGGGSSNAANTLKLLNNYFSLNISTLELEHLSATLGSDCPFFIQNIPQYVTGRGEILTPISINLKGLFFVLICPNVPISTKMAYQSIKPQPSTYSLKEVIQQPISTWKEMIDNDFETALFPQFPILKEIKNFLYNHGAIYASMSGSGSSFYGFFNQLPELPPLHFEAKMFQGQF